MALLFLQAFPTAAQSGEDEHRATRFLGRDVKVTEPPHDDFGFGESPASVCLEAPPLPQCYTAPKNFTRVEALEVVQVKPDFRALLFSTSSGGVSGWSIGFALLRPGSGGGLDDLFVPEVTVSNQSEHVFWDEPTISDAKIFVTADYIWGPDDAHYSEHRYMISAYVLQSSDLIDGERYYLYDRYMTVRKYDPDARKILDSEKDEILARLRRVKAETEPKKE